jgi:regulator of sigma E protease
MESVIQLLHYSASFIAIISIIVFVHEFGHFYIARLCNVKVDSFSIGFGPEIFGWNDKKGTRWKVSLFPLGGYVKMFGDETAASTPDSKKLKKMTAKEKKVAFQYKPLHQKAAIVFAGPAVNFLFAMVVLTGLFMVYGRPISLPEVGTVMEKSAAAEAGILPGDRFIEIDGSAITRFEDIRRVVSLHPEIALTYTIDRKGQLTEGTLVPKLSETTDAFGNTVKIGIIGITPSSVEYAKLNFAQSAIASVEETWSITTSTLQAVGQMITGKRSADELSGIMRIAKFSGQSTEQGLGMVLWFMALLSINLGLINLFPIPMLDGGHLMYYAIEAVSGKPLAEKAQEYGFKVGMVLLVALMLFATFNDIRHFGWF